MEIQVHILNDIFKLEKYENYKWIGQNNFFFDCNLNYMKYKYITLKWTSQMEMLF